jgi:hypothetical protein
MGVVFFDLNKLIVVACFLPVVDPVTARSERGEETPREGFLTLPRIQIF